MVLSSSYILKSHYLFSSADNEQQQQITHDFLLAYGSRHQRVWSFLRCPFAIQKFIPTKYIASKVLAVFVDEKFARLHVNALCNTYFLLLFHGDK
jgi:hypothetical protein